VKEAERLYDGRVASLERYLEGECVMAAARDGYSLPSEKMIADVDSIKRRLRLRAEIFAKLAETYKGFEALALFDDGGALETSIRGLSDSINDYSAVLGRPVVATSADTDLAALAGRGLFKAYHESRITAASAVIRKRLERLLKLLTDGKEKNAVLAMERIEQRAKLKLALALWDAGLALPDAILNEHIEAYGLTPNKSVTMRQIDRETTGRMKTAVANVLAFRERRAIHANRKAYDAVVETMKTLIAAHKALERGVPPSFKSLAENLREIRGYARVLRRKKNEADR
jgi:hypothetical protein